MPNRFTMDASYFTGNAYYLKSLTGASQGTYGGSSNVPQITVETDGRIAIISNVASRIPNIDEVLASGNTATTQLPPNSMLFTNASNVISTNPELTYDDTTGILIADGGTGGVIARILEHVKINAGVDVKKGQPMYIFHDTGNNSDLMSANLAINTDSLKMPAVGLLSQDSVDGVENNIVRVGTIPDFDPIDIFVETLSNNDVGKVVYVSSVVGKLTITRPTHPDKLIQNIGVITKRKNNGNINLLVQGAGRANDIPNQIDTHRANVHQTVTIGGGPYPASANLYVQGNVFVTEEITSTGIALSNATTLGGVSGMLVSNVLTLDCGNQTIGSGNISVTGTNTNISSIIVSNMRNNAQVMFEVNPSADIIFGVTSVTGNVLRGFKTQVDILGSAGEKGIVTLVKVNNNIYVNINAYI
tara:strand:+ start:1648 stop:2895 length:1248 start_codon:yes stop_codon:yes gene_type:complete